MLGFQHPARVQRRWQEDFGILFLLAFATTLPFWLTDLDLVVMQWFYQPDHPQGPWPVGREPFFHFLYVAIPVVTLGLVLGTLMILIGALRFSRLRRFRSAAVLLLLGLLLGPGLLVNAVFKEHWGRDRPRQVETLGGLHAYHPPLVKVAEGRGKSFPCGHCSVAFVLGAFWLLWRAHAPQRARVALVIALSLGALVGIARMGAGGHFLSDVLWSLWFTALALLIVYHFILRLPERATATDVAPPSTGVLRRYRHRTRLAVALYGVLGILLMGGALLSIPQVTQFRANLPQDPLDPAVQILQISARKATVHLLLVHPEDSLDAPADLVIQGDFRGVGLPGKRLYGEYALETLPSGATALVFRLQEQGLFTELEGTLTVRVPLERWKSVSVQLQQGDVRVSADPAQPFTTTLEVHTERGRVFW